MRFPATRPAPGSAADVLVLCYHAVSADWPELIAIGPARLEAQVARLLGAGWRPATFTGAVLAPPAARTLAVTFDDAFRSVYRDAAPLLRRLGVPATVFVPTAFPGSGRRLAWGQIERWVGTPHEVELESASWEELGELRDQGWEIGSHSVSHPLLTELEAGELARELRESKAEIERRLGVRCRSIAYPFGAVDDRVAEQARVCGYEAGGALLPLRRRGDPLRCPRVFISSAEGEALHRLHVSRPMRWAQSTAAWPGVQRSLERLVRARGRARGAGRR